MKRNVPRLRFKEFDDEWKEKKLGKLGESLIGLTYSPDDITDKDNGILVLRSSNVQNGKLTFSDNVFVNCKIKEKIKVKDNDILICSRNGSKALIGKSALIKNLDAEATFGAFMTIFRCENGQFIHQLINTREFFKQINMNLGATINQITSNNLNNFKFSIPSLQEQEKIANFLTKVDSLIEEQDGKVKDLELYKKGMMQKIFSQGIRFKDDNGCEYPEWEDKQIKDIFDVTRGQVIAKSTITEERTGSNIYPVYSSQTSNQGILGYDSSYDFEGRYLTWTTDGANAGKVFKRDGRFRCTNVCGLLVEKEITKGYANSCIKELLEKVTPRHVSYVGNPKLMNGVMADIKINIPCVEEQTKIANFLSNIDSIIEQEKNKLEDLRQWKKGLLQQMFV